MKSKMRSRQIRGLWFLLLIFMLFMLIFSVGIVQAMEPVVIRVLSANPNNRTYTFICADNGSGLAGNGVRNWFLYPEDTGVDELITTLPANQPLTYTFQRNAYYDITCNDPNPIGLNYTSLYRHSLHIDLRTQLGNPAVIPLSVAQNSITEKCVYNGTNYSMSWFLSSYTFTGGSGNTVRYSLNSTNSILTFTPPVTPGLFDTHCLIHFTDGRPDIDLPTGIDFPKINAAPYVADQYGINLAGNYAPFNYNTWITLHNGNGIPINNTGNNTGNQTNTTITIAGNLNITTTPGGVSITINGSNIESTSSGSSGSLLKTNISAGTIIVGATLQGYNSYQNNFNIIANQTTMLNIILQANNTNNNSTNSSGNTSNSTNSTVYLSAKDIPAICTGGNVASDVWNGGRTITCANGLNTLTITAWNKPTNTAPQYFEIYLKSLTGSGLKICLLGTCISNNGYAKSPNFPITG